MTFFSRHDEIWWICKCIYCIYNIYVYIRTDTGHMLQLLMLLLMVCCTDSIGLRWSQGGQSNSLDGYWSRWQVGWQNRSWTQSILAVFRGAAPFVTIQCWTHVGALRIATSLILIRPTKFQKLWHPQTVLYHCIYFGPLKWVIVWLMFEMLLAWGRELPGTVHRGNGIWL